jgi:alkylation response protein AidB-like acyl-CoA dehydrogenase
VLAGAASLDQIRRIAVGDADASGALETALADFGLASLLVPEDAGGLGLGLLDACLVQEALGYHIAPSGFLANALACKATRYPIALGHASVEAAITPLAAGCPRLRHLSLSGNPLCRLPWWRACSRRRVPPRLR